RLGTAVVLPAVDQPRLAPGPPPRQHPAYRRGTAPQRLGDLRCGPPLCRPQHDQVPGPEPRVVGPAAFSFQPLARLRAQFDPPAVRGYNPSVFHDGILSAPLQRGSLWKDAIFTPSPRIARGYLVF